MSTSTGHRDRGAYGAPPAPVGRRVGAALVDGVLTALCAAPLWAALLPAWLASGGAGATAAPPGPAPVLLLAGAALLVVWGAVQWWCQGTRGWTVGRRLLGLRTVDVRSGRPVGLGRALARSLVVVAGALACGVGQLLVLLSPLLDGTGRRRGWHDRVAEAVVVDVRGLVAARRVGVPDRASRRPAPAAPAATTATVGEVPAAAPLGAADPLAPVAGVPLPVVPSGPAVPGAAVPGAAVPGLAVPGAAVPGLAVPGLAVPGLAVPGPAVPGPAVSTVPSAPEGPDTPARTRWTALAAERKLDAPDLVLPALGTPGLGPDLDTRQLPRVAAGLPGDVPPAPGGAAVVVEPASRPAAVWTPPPTPVGPQHAGPTEPEHPAPAPGGVPPADGQDPEPLTPVPSAAVLPPATLPPTALPPAPSAALPAPAPSPALPSPALPAPALPAPALPAPAPGVAGPWSEPVASPAGAVPLVPSPVPGPPAAALPPELFPPAVPSPTGAPAWVVRLPDGVVLDLEVPLLVGRNPDATSGIRPVAVADPARSVSKTHLLLGVDEHGPWVVDRGSTNGTLVTLGDGQRIVCLPDRRVRLTDGSLVAFGDLSLSVRVRA